MPSWDGRAYGCHAWDVGRAGSARSRGDLPHALSADDALGPVLDAYHQRQHTGKTRFIGIWPWHRSCRPCGGSCTAGTSIRCWRMTICSSGPCTHVGFPPGRSSPHLVAGGDGVLPDEPGHCDHRARREKCGGDRRTGGVCHPAPDSTTTSHLLTGTLRAGLPRRQHSPRGHRRTEGRSAMTATRESAVLSAL